MIGALVVLGNHFVDFSTIYHWHKCKYLTAVLLLNQVVKHSSTAVIFYKVVTISPSVQEQLKEYGVFKRSAELQASLFIVCLGVISLNAILYLWMIVSDVVQRNWYQVLDIENPQSTQLEMVTNEVPSRQDVNEKDNIKKQCVICCENERTHACSPCGHISLCVLCAEKLSEHGINGQDKPKCPKCRLEVDTIIRIYL